MLIGAMSDEVFSDDLIPHLDRVVADIADDPATVGSLKTFTNLAVLPSREDMDSYIRTSDFQTKYGDDALVRYRSSGFFSVISSHRANVVEPCCEHGNSPSSDRLVPEDVFSFITSPTSIGTRIEPKYQFHHFCKVHQVRIEVAPVLKLNTYQRDKDVPLTLMDTFALTTIHTKVSNFTVAQCTVLELINAYGISAGFDKGGFNTAYYPHTGKFESDYAAFSQVAPKGMALSWLMLAGWRGKSSKIVMSRLATMVELAQVMDTRDVLRYLDAGSRNIREVAVFHKAGISHEVVAQAFALGISNPKTMRTLIDEGIDFSLMESLVGGDAMVFA